MDIVSEFFPALVLVTCCRHLLREFVVSQETYCSGGVGVVLLDPGFFFLIKGLPVYSAVLSLVHPQQLVTAIKNVSAEYTQTERTERQGSGGFPPLNIL